MAEPVEKMIVSERAVVCNGEKDSLGHPRVYLRVNREGYVDCPYCGKRFIYEEE